MAIMENGERMADGTLPSYAWPGGYPLYYVVVDGGALCPDCARMAEREGLGVDAAWAVVGADVNYEDDALYCDHCGRKIEPSYDLT
jgi:hypothetical protein